MSLGRSLACALLAASACLVPAQAIAASAPITLDVALQSTCIDGTAQGLSAVRVDLRTGDGQLRGTGSSRVSRGRFEVCLPMLSGVNGGDIVEARGGGSYRRLRVPDLLTDIDRVHDIVQGRSVAGSIVAVSIDRPGASPAKVSVVAGPHGHYAASAPSSADIVGGTAVAVSVRLGPDIVRAWSSAPALAIFAGSESVLGVDTPGRAFTVKVLGPDGLARSRMTTSADATGSFWLRLSSAQGTPVYPRAGDTVVATFAADAVLPVPASRLRGQVRSRQVRGRCMPSASYALWVYGSRDTSRLVGTTKPDGSVSRTVPRRAGPASGSVLELDCRYPSGDTFTVLGRLR